MHHTVRNGAKRSVDCLMVLEEKSSWKSNSGSRLAKPQLFPRLARQIIKRVGFSWHRYCRKQGSATPRLSLMREMNRREEAASGYEKAKTNSGGSADWSGDLCRRVRTKGQ